MRPRLLDLFCGAGGAAMGYHRAGFDVVGVDIVPQPNYPFEFVQMDALSALKTLHAGGAVVAKGVWEEGFAAIHASPPCQAYSRNMKHLSAPQPMLIDDTRQLLQQTGIPWVIENVEGSPLPDQNDLFGRHGVVLCGTSFGLRVWRHRWFETTFPVPQPACAHARSAMNPHNVAGRDRMYEEFGRSDPEVIWAREMGVEWMGRYEAREAIPPVYCQFIGDQLLAHIRQEKEA